MAPPERLPLFLQEPPPAGPVSPSRGGSVSFLERALVELCGVLRRLYIQWDLAAKEGLLQRTDPRVKVALLASAVVLVSLKQSLEAQVAMGALLLGLTLLSRIPLKEVQGRAILVTMLFGLILPAPSALNLTAQGEVLIPIFSLEEPTRFLWFHLPKTVGLTREGLLGVTILAFRIMNSMTATLLVLNGTPFADIVKALKHFKLPDTLVWVVLLTYRYLFVLVNLVEQMHRARSARLVKGADSTHTRRWAALRMAFLFQRSQQRCEEIFRAMQSRGFSGKVRVEPLEALEFRDLVGMGVMAALIGLIGSL